MKQIVLFVSVDLLRQLELKNSVTVHFKTKKSFLSNEKPLFDLNECPNPVIKNWLRIRHIQQQQSINIFIGCCWPYSCVSVVVEVVMVDINCFCHISRNNRCPMEIHAMPEYQVRRNTSWSKTTESGKEQSNKCVNMASWWQKSFKRPL